MKLLLDTHVWLWTHMQPDKLSRRVSSALESSHNELWFSPVSAWELTFLVGRRRFRLNKDPRQWVSEALEKQPMLEAPVTLEVALALGDIMVPHADPADLFLAATAAVYDLTLVTADEKLLAGRGFRHMANR